MTQAPTIKATAPDSMPSTFSWRAWVTLFVLTALLYALTACRGTQWQDPGHMILRIVTGEVWHPLGLALAHPVHHWLGRLAVWPGIGEPAYAVTLVSAFAGAVAVANIFGIVVTLTGRRTAAIIAAMAFALSHTHWQMATRAEVYTVTTALFSGECWCLIVFARTGQRRFMWLMFLLNGLGIGNHMLGSLTTPVLVVILVFALRNRRVRFGDAVVAAVLWLVGTMPYGAMVVLEFVRTQDAAGTIRSALFGHGFSKQVLHAGLSSKNIAISLAMLALNFPSLLIPAAIYGIGRVDRSRVPTLVTRSWLAAAVIHLCFVVRYDVIDQHTFYLPLYVLLTIFAGMGVAAVERVAARWRRPVLIAIALSVLVMPAFYAVTPALARRFNVLRSVKRDKPYRDDYVYVFTPWSVADASADTMAREAVRLAGDRGVILVEDSMGRFAVQYAVGRAGTSDVRVIVVAGGADVDLRQAITESRPIVLVPRKADEPNTPAPGEWIRRGDLYVLKTD